MILLLVFAYAMSSRIKPFTLVLGCIALFFMGGRTALFVFALTGILMTFKGNILRNTIVSVLLVLSCVGIFWYSVLSGLIDLEAKAVREILFLDGLDEDESYQGRINLLLGNMSLLADQFWIGNFGLVSQRQGGVSGYVHNILSAWQFYGFFIFAILIFCLYYCLRRMVSTLKHSDLPADVFGSFLLIYVLISVVVSKYVGWHLLWFVLGFWLMKASRDLSSAKTKTKRKSRRRRKERNAIYS